MIKKFLNKVDLTLTVLSTLLCVLFVLIPPLNETPIRIILGIPLVLFLPGYSLVAALYPKIESLDGIERITLSFGLSIAIAPLLGLALNYTPFGINLTSVLIVLSTFTITLSLVAWVRRMKLPEEERFRVPFDRLLRFKSLLGVKRIDKILSIILVASIIGTSITLVYVVVTPKTGERFTEFYILDSNGTASDYPTNLTIGEEGRLVIGIVNMEYDNVTYRLELNFNETMIYQEYVFLTHNETWKTPFTFKPTIMGENQKLEFLLNKDGEVYRTLHIFVDVH
jgi:uncharacterized membrane protein